jgi:hypothetical protein
MLFWCPTSLGRFNTQPSLSFRDLGIFIDKDLTLRRHADAVVARCFSALGQLRGFHKSEPLPVLQTSVTWLARIRLDYGIAVLVDLPVIQLRRLHPVQNACRSSSHLRSTAVRSKDRCFDMSTHWLRVPQA